jgi:sugar-specific transcriptional regulator TrmB
MELFHKSFLNILEDKDPLQKNNYTEMQAIDLAITDSDDVVNLAHRFISGVKRPQHLIKTRDDYYIARDTLTNTVYICFRNLLTIDIDRDFENDIIINHFTRIPETFRIYRSKRGYHIYCTSREFEYRSKESVDFMLNNNSDPYYCVYSYIRGFCTRLNNKFTDCGENIYNYVGKVGDKPEITRLVKLTEIMMKLSKNYKNDVNLN